MKTKPAQTQVHRFAPYPQGKGRLRSPLSACRSTLTPGDKLGDALPPQAPAPAKLPLRAPRPKATRTGAGLFTPGASRSPSPLDLRAGAATLASIAQAAPLPRFALRERYPEAFLQPVTPPDWPGAEAPFPSEETLQLAILLSNLAVESRVGLVPA